MSDQHNEREKELEECPFCGSTVRFRRVWKPSVSYRGYVGCMNPKCKVRPCTNLYSRVETAIKAWNNRIGED